MDVAAGLSAATQALTLVKALRDLDRSVAEAEYKAKIVDLMEFLTDARIALVEAREAIGERDAEIRRLKEVQAGKAKTVFHNGYNFGLTPDGKPMGLPFCPTCEKTKGMQFQIVKLMLKHYQCPSCEALMNSPPTILPGNLIPSSTE